MSLIRKIKCSFTFALVCFVFVSLQNPIYADTSSNQEIAILFGMADYYDDSYNLNGPINDVIGINGTLQDLGFQVYSYMNCSESQLLSLIDSTVITLSSSDTLLFYYSGHAADGGYLFCADGGFVSIQELESRLSNHAGTKVVLIDACFSGDFISKDVELSPESSNNVNISSEVEFNDYVISVFSESESTAGRSIDQAGYKVLTASSGEQVSYERLFYKSSSTYAMNNYTNYIYSDAFWIGCFTEAFHDACGLYETTPLSSFLADTNNSNSLTLNEMYIYTRDKVASNQDVQVYPSNDDTVLVTRNKHGNFIADNVIDIADINQLASYYNQQSYEFDLNGDNTVNLYDLVIVGQNFTD